MSGYGGPGTDPVAAELSRLNDELGASDTYDLAALDPGLQAELDAAEAELAAAGIALDSLTAGQPLPELGAIAAQRQAEDAEGFPMDTEARTAHLLDRAARGTYTPPQPLDDAAHGCGPLDAYGRCGSRYHDAYCFETARGEAANGSAESADAWRRTLLGNHQATTALRLANERLAAQDDAQAAQGVRGSAAYREMRGLLGLGR